MNGVKPYQTIDLRDDVLTQGRLDGALAEVDRTRLQGGGVLLVEINSRGGAAAAALRLYEGLRRFSQDGGMVVTFVEQAGSAAALVAVAGDYVVLAPGGRFVIHASCGATAEVRAELERECIDVLAARTKTARAELETAYETFDPCTVFRADLALREGWADAIGAREVAEAFAERAAREQVHNIIPVTFTERNPIIDWRANSTAYAVGDRFKVSTPAVRKIHVYQVTTAGTSDSSQPAAYTGSPGEAIHDGSLWATEQGAETDPSFSYTSRSLEDPEPVDVALNGPRRGSAVQLPMICLPEVALTISRLRAQRAVKRRNTYTFKVGWRFARLQPLDYVTISDKRFGLVNVVVRIVAVEEDGGVLTIEAEDAPLGISHAIAHPTQSSDSSFVGRAWKSVEVRAHEMAMRNWTARTTPALNYKAVTWGADKWVAVADAAGTQCATSPDGETWTARTIPSGTYGAVAWNGSLFVAVGSSVCATSPDGITWTARTIPAGAYSSVTWHEPAGKWVAVGDNCISYSSNGIAWSAATVTWPTTTYGGSLVCVASNGVMLVAAGLAADAVTNQDLVMTSTDGVTWTRRRNSLAYRWNACVAGNGLFCLVGQTADVNTSPKCASSSDGINWVERTVLDAANGRPMQAVVWTGSVFAAVDYTSSGQSGRVITSVDGITWESATTGPLPSLNGYLGMAWSGRKAVAVTPGQAATSMSL
jgi:hypothetical protein